MSPVPLVFLVFANIPLCVFLACVLDINIYVSVIWQCSCPRCLDCSRIKDSPVAGLEWKVDANWTSLTMGDRGVLLPQLGNMDVLIVCCPGFGQIHQFEVKSKPAEHRNLARLTP